MEFTNEDLSMLPKLYELESNLKDNNSEWAKKQKEVNEYIEPALELYFKKNNFNFE